MAPDEMARAVVLVLAVLLVAVAGGREPPHVGPYDVAMRVYEDIEGLWPPWNNAVVVYPVGAGAGERFPLVSYAHGAGAGGPPLYDLYQPTLDALASHGFVVVATQSCRVGAGDNCRDDGAYWSTYWREQVFLLEWARGVDDEVMDLVDHSIPYGVAGHSTGGQATARSCNHAAEYGIGACVSQHPLPAPVDADDEYGSTTAAFLGESAADDVCCGERSTRRIYDAINVTKSIAISVEGGHVEPNVPDNHWRAYTAAWFKVHLLGDTAEYYDVIYNGTNPNSLCGGHIEMVACEHVL